jgi:hypothetical protein
MKTKPALPIRIICGDCGEYLTTTMMEHLRADHPGMVRYMNIRQQAMILRDQTTKRVMKTV